MINAIDKPAIFIDTNYSIQAVNQLYRDLYDTQITLNNSKCYEISHKADSPCDQHGESCPLKECAQTGKATSVIHIHQTGSESAYCDILMRPVIDDDGITIGFLEIIDKLDYASHDVGKAELVGVSNAFQYMLKLINRGAKSEINILLSGETGTGKELAAKAIHQASDRSRNPFVVVECIGLAETLFESELFGYEKGAFTGALARKQGLVDLAHGGTLFLDEIGDVPLSQQVKLLRLIETGMYRPVGSMQYKKADFRLICASHKNLIELVKKEQFREDLYYRIAAFPIELPSLKQRVEDLPLLANHFLSHSEFSNKRLSKKALSSLKHHSFPGNIRELKNLIERAAIISDDDLIEQILVGDSAQDHHYVQGEQIEIKPLEQVEAEYLKSLLSTNKQSIEELAIAMGISGRTLHRKLKKHSIHISTKNALNYEQIPVCSK